MKPHVLVVDASLAQRMLAAKCVAEVGGITIVALNGAMAIRAAKTVRPDLIVSNYELPDMSGHSLVRQLKSDEATREIPIALAARSWPESERAWAMLLGVIACLAMPFEAAEFLDFLRSRLPL